MVLGTASSVGKSTLVTALCRIVARRGIRVAPFKAQNMSNNAAVTADGGEIAPSIAVQAAAARIEPTVRMNPVLLKPEGERRSQIVVEGRPWHTVDAQDYWRRKTTLWGVEVRYIDRPAGLADAALGHNHPARGYRVRRAGRMSIGRRACMGLLHPWHFCQRAIPARLAAHARLGRSRRCPAPRSL